MRGFLRLFMWAAVLFGGGLVAIRLIYGVSWRESFEIANCFVKDLLG